MKRLPALSALAFLFTLCTGAQGGVILSTDFSNGTLYPSGSAMGTVADGLGTWSFASSARAVGVPDHGRGIRFTGTSFSVYNFSAPVSTGSITVEFSFIPISTTSAFDIQLSAGTENSEIGPQLRFGVNAASDVTYYDGTAFTTIAGASFSANELNTFSFTAHVDGVNAGTFDFAVNGSTVATGLVWRNLDLESLSMLRVRTPNSAAQSDLVSLTISAEAIPEPETFALLFGAAGCWVLWQGRRRMAAVRCHG
ncbi:MAG TPA: hypothetical protein VNQ90_16720 [Chthoniobacteraceae bacterium]|nr:hypothetical protein [Chthoniobacteraceae bacterium]